MGRRPNCNSVPPPRGQFNSHWLDWDTRWRDGMQWLLSSQSATLATSSDPTVLGLGKAVSLRCSERKLRACSVQDEYDKRDQQAAPTHNSCMQQRSTQPPSVVL